MNVIFAKFYPLRVENTGARPSYDGLIFLNKWKNRKSLYIKSLRQNALFQANQMNPKFKLILGKYLKKKFKCKNCNFQNDTFEEKESDVRIATQIVADAFRKNCDISIVVSADSDMIPAIELAMEENHPVFSYFPPFQRSSAIESMFTSVIKLERYESRFKNSILPDVVTLKNGFQLCIPDKWKNYKVAFA